MKKGGKKDSIKSGAGASAENAGNVSGNPVGEGVGAGKGKKNSSGGDGGGDGGGGPGPPSGSHTASSGNPLSSLTRRVLVLSQKGDWVACEATLRLLEKEATAVGTTNPLDGIADNVRANKFPSKQFVLYPLCIQK